MAITKLTKLKLLAESSTISPHFCVACLAWQAHRDYFYFLSGVCPSRHTFLWHFFVTLFFTFSNLFWQSGAKINISDGSCPERIVTITGTTDNIHKAFTMICSKFEEVRVVPLCAFYTLIREIIRNNAFYRGIESETKSVVLHFLKK